MADIKIKSLDGQEFNAYLAEPAAASCPAIIVVQEIFGISDSMRTVCNQLAQSGYLTVCPDLFWRLEPGVSLSDKAPDDVVHGFDLYRHFDTEAGVRDLLAAIAYMRKSNKCNGKVGVVGYCMGGKLACLVAARSDVDCAVSFYGVGIESMLDEFPDIRQPLFMIMIENDKLVSAVAKDKIIAAINRSPFITHEVYAGEHAFARPDGPNFDEKLANHANSKMLRFFAEHLHG